jgi:hypothetical protein
MSDFSWSTSAAQGPNPDTLVWQKLAEIMCPLFECREKRDILSLYSHNAMEGEGKRDV